MTSRIKSYSASFWLWLLLLLALTGVIAIESMRLLHLPDGEMEKAEDAGQRITFVLETGETIPSEFGEQAGNYGPGYTSNNAENILRKDGPGILEIDLDGMQQINGLFINGMRHLPCRYTPVKMDA